MNKTHKKLALIAISAFVVEAALVVGVATNFNAIALNPIKASNTDYSVTFSRSASTVESGSYASGSAIVSSRLSGGTKVFANINGYSIPSQASQNIVRFLKDSNHYVKFYISDPSVKRFQSITSLDFVYSDGGNFDIYYSTQEINFSDPSTYTKIEVHDAPSNVAISDPGIHYVALRGRDVEFSDSAYFNSIKINYSCGEPVPESYGISYYGMNLDGDVIPLEGIDTSSLINEALEGSTVVIEPEASSGYTFLGGFGYSEAVEDVVDDNGVITFTMPSTDVEFVLVSRPTVPQLYSISISGYQTEFTQGDSFVFGGTVTARYTDGSTSDVTASATFSGYDMSTIGSQTVTVSYSYLGVTKTATYGITVTSDDPGVVTLSGKYQYVSRTHSGSGYSDWPNMYIEFNSDGTATWHNERTNYLGDYVCDMYFLYTAEDNGSNIAISMSRDADRTPHHSGYYGYWFLLDGSEKNSENAWSGGGYDRPIDGAFTVAFKNNSGVMNLAKTSLTINVYDKNHSYEVYDTFTFNLVS